MKIGTFVLIVILSLSGVGCATKSTHPPGDVDQERAEADRHFSRKRPSGLSFHETGFEIMVTKLSATSARLGFVYKRRIENVSAAAFGYEDTVLTFEEIECRSGESAEYRLELDPVKGPRFVRGTIVPNQDGLWLKVSCTSDERGVVVDYQVGGRDGDLDAFHVAGRQRAEDPKK